MEEGHINTSTLKLTMSNDANVEHILERHGRKLQMETVLDRFGYNLDIERQYHADMKEMKQNMHNTIREKYCSKNETFFPGDMTGDVKNVIQQPSFYNGMRVTADAMIRMIQMGSHIGVELFPRAGEKDDDRRCCLTEWAALLARKLIYEGYDY
jgi:hypothetical protein